METTNILQIGTCVNIQRSDVSIHSAVVVDVNNETESVTVEWIEQDDTKRKVIDISVITELNPDIKIVKPSENEEEEEEKEESSNEAELQLTASHKFDECDQQSAGIAKATRLTRAATSTPTDQRSDSGSTYSTGAIRKLAEEPNYWQPMPTQSSAQFQKQARWSRATLNVQRRNVWRKSVVKEAEKLKNNKEEQRQLQAEDKAESETFLQMTVENPHLELFNMIQEYRQSLEIKPLTGRDAIVDRLITVCVRKRPLNSEESAKKELDVITIPSKNQLILHEPKSKVDLTKYIENQMFGFDHAFDETCANDDVYMYTARPLIKVIFEGGFATCFAYGQTGSGKTHTMGGDFTGTKQDYRKGIYAMAAADVLAYATSNKYRPQNLVIAASFFEIYSAKVYDLLNNKAKLKILEDDKQEVKIVGLTEKVITTVKDALKLIQKGNYARTSVPTSANSNSSRSHAVFQIVLRSRTSIEKVYGKFSFIDLAGNERGADTSSADRQTQMEGAEINKSLLALKECIRALARKDAHLPFRASKLTQVLRDSFVGSNSRTCMIAMISPGLSSCEHSLNTLRYADRVKKLGGGDLAQGGGGDSKHDDSELTGWRPLSASRVSRVPELGDYLQVRAELQVANENVRAEHEELVYNLYTTHDKAASLLKMCKESTLDDEAYCTSLKQLLDEQIVYILRIRDLVTDYEAKLATEKYLEMEKY